MPTDFQATIRLAERRFSVVFKKTPKEFSEWCAEEYQNSKEGVWVHNIALEYKLFITNQLNSIIHQHHPKIWVQLEEASDGCDKFSMYVNTSGTYQSNDEKNLVGLRADLRIF